jgi:hypothetical protein
VKETGSQKGRYFYRPSLERKKAMKNFFAAKREAEAKNRSQKVEGKIWKVVDVRGTWQVRLQYHINKLAAK